MAHRRWRAGSASLRFADREEAGSRLAEGLSDYAGPNTVVLALPRGGVVVGEPIARALRCELDVIVSRKIGAPWQPELALGAVAEGDHVFWNEDVVAGMGLSEHTRNEALAQARRELEERHATYRAVRPRAQIAGRTVIVTDDGVATGATLKAAIGALQAEGAARIVVALPGGPADTLAEIERLPGVEAVVALAVPELFWAVGQLYDRFDQVSTPEVCDILRRSGAAAP